MTICVSSLPYWILVLQERFKSLSCYLRTPIVEMAANIADERGIANVTLKVLAAELGVKSPSLYKHFNGGLDELNKELMLYGCLIIAGAALLYWKVIEKKPLTAMGLSKEIGTYFIGIILSIFNMQSVGGSIWNGSIYGIEASAAATIVWAFAAVLVFVIGRKTASNDYSRIRADEFVKQD